MRREQTAQFERARRNVRDPKKEDDMKTWKQLEAIAKRQGMSLDIRSTVVAIDGNKGTNELFAVSCDIASKKDRLFLLCIETALKELGAP